MADVATGTAAHALAVIRRLRERLQRNYVHTSPELLKLIDGTESESGFDELLDKLELFAQRLPGKEAAELRALVLQAKGEL